MQSTAMKLKIGRGRHVCMEEKKIWKFSDLAYHCRSQATAFHRFNREKFSSVARNQPTTPEELEAMNFL